MLTVYVQIYAPFKHWIMELWVFIFFSDLTTLGEFLARTNIDEGNTNAFITETYTPSKNQVHRAISSAFSPLQIVLISLSAVLFIILVMYLLSYKITKPEQPVEYHSDKKNAHYEDVKDIRLNPWRPTCTADWFVLPLLVYFFKNLDIPLSRSVLDNVCKKFGYKMLDFCKNNKLYIVNGRVGSDKMCWEHLCAKTVVWWVKFYVI